MNPKTSNTHFYSENQLSEIIITQAMSIHTVLGPGLLESAYEKVLVFTLRTKGLYIETQKLIPLIYQNQVIGEAYRADIVVERKVLIELKSVKELEPIHLKQTLTYIRLSGLKLGLVINFNTLSLKNGIKRVVNNLN